MPKPKKKRPASTPSTAALPTISASVFKATCLELMDDLAARNAEVIVTKHGRPIVKVGPVDDQFFVVKSTQRGASTARGWFPISVEIQVSASD